MKISVVTPLWQDRPAMENLEVAINADRLGYPELWIGEMATFDAFALATSIGQATRQIELSIGPLAVSVRTPMTLAMGVASVAELCGRQTNLALGASSTVVVDEWHGQERSRTATHLAETAQIVRALLGGDKVDFEGELARCKGYRLRLNPHPGPLTLAAFGPAAVRAAGRHADRLLLNIVTPNSVAQLGEQVKIAATDVGRPAPSVAVWLTCAINPDKQTINQLLRTVVSYVAAPGYAQMISDAGFDDLVTFARTRPHPKELLAAMPEALLSAIGLVGSENQVGDRIEDYRAAGVDEICLVPVTAEDPGATRILETMKSIAL